MARIEVGGERGVVRWEGEVGDTGHWLGVEWDRQGRGRHGGSHRGQQYFTPSRPGQDTCSFVRRAKVTQWGGGLLEAVRRRYGVVEGDTAGVEEAGMAELQVEIGARFVQVVGFDKVNRQQSDIRHLRTASVRNLGVSGPGDCGAGLAAELPALRDLDLSESLVSDWAEVGEIACQLGLQELDLSYNLLPVSSLPGGLVMETVRHLVLGHMLYSGYTWQEILSLAAHLPSLAVLQVHNNDISRLALPGGQLFAQLTELDLDGNSLTDWVEVNSLAGLPGLQHLRLNGNRLVGIAVEAGGFPSLESLQLSGNCVSDWTSVGTLDLLPRLVQLRLRANPVCSQCKDEETARQLIIARIGRLASLNGTAVSAAERKWAEIDYLKQYGPGWLEAGRATDPAAAKLLFLAAHNRYDRVVAQHGEPDPGDGVATDTRLVASLVRVKVRAPQLLATPDTVKKLPASMTVRALRALLQRLYRAQAGEARVRVSLLPSSATRPDQEVALDNDMRDIGFFSVGEGDSLLVRWGEDAGMPIVTDL